MFSLAQKRNIYVISFFEPTEDNDVSNLLYTTFNPDENIIMLGGNFDKQNICDLSRLDQSQLSAELPYNLGIMKYKGNFHPLLVPCGEIRKIIVDEDDQDIF